MKIQIRSNVVSGGIVDVPPEVDCFVGKNGVWLNLKSEDSFFDDFRDLGFVVDSSDSAFRKIPWENSDCDCWLRVLP